MNPPQELHHGAPEADDRRGDAAEDHLQVRGLRHPGDFQLPLDLQGLLGARQFRHQRHHGRRALRRRPEVRPRGPGRRQGSVKRSRPSSQLVLQCFNIYAATEQNLQFHLFLHFNLQFHEGF